MSENLINKFLNLNIPVVLFPTQNNEHVSEKQNLPVSEKIDSAKNPTEYDRYIITYKNNVDSDEKTKKFDKMVGFHSQHIFKSSMNGCAATLNKGLLKQVIDDDDVTDIEKDEILYTNCLYEKEQIPEGELTIEQTNYWHQTITNMTKGSTDDFSTIHCYVLDTGIMPNHYEFNTGQVVLDYNAIDKTSNAVDNNGHGTAVASVLGGKNVGVCNKIKLHSIKVLNSTGSGYTSDIISGINWVLNNKISPCVINMSLGGAFSSTLNAAVQNCINLGIQIICASGNEGIDAKASSPANAVGVLTVSAYDNKKTRPSWANYGSVVRTFGPGAAVRAAWGDTPSSYYLVSGTSFACPIVAGVVCRMLKENPNLTPTQIREALGRMNYVGEIINPGSTTTPNLRVVWDPNRVKPC